MATVTGITRGGGPWTPSFVTALDHGRCIGCGRCYKVCSREVFDLMEREELDEEIIGEDGFEEDAHMVMVIRNANDCIGCLACTKVCPKQCHSHSPWERAA